MENEEIKEGCANEACNQDGKNGQDGCQRSEEAAPKTDAAEATAEQKLAEVQDKYIRLVAEFDNYRKRTVRERLELLATAAEDTIKGILPVLDDIERAKKTMENVTDVAAVKEGVDLIYQKLQDYLSSKGLQAVESAQGTAFDTDVHDAVSKFPVSEEAQRNKIFDTLQKGYKLNDKIIRYAKVVVGE
ncbi:MAG: nucleotide exchange factor GrpE [Prevotellaceae bacterium]|jgi:molecular chaperone GrpE|nr:nucleotide exchange factor GrpE [Prevotellaceae bacterium]